VRGFTGWQIAFVDYQMTRAAKRRQRLQARIPHTQWRALNVRAGAIGYLIRSAGTDLHRNPHTSITGSMTWADPVT
jgi:hypothetical protein